MDERLLSGSQTKVLEVVRDGHDGVWMKDLEEKLLDEVSRNEIRQAVEKLVELGLIEYHAHDDLNPCYESWILDCLKIHGPMNLRDLYAHMPRGIKAWGNRLRDDAMSMIRNGKLKFSDSRKIELVLIDEEQVASV
jgi:hypothetical protein